jgi:hypothetical protein
MLLAVEVAYVLGANIFLNSERAFDAINRKPEKLWLHWRNGWTLIPGVVHLEGLQIRGQDRQFQWHAQVDEITTSMSLWALIGKRFRTTSVRGSGLRFRMRERLPLGSKPGKEVELAPDIPGLSNPPERPPEQLYPPQEIEHPWTIELRNALVTDLREIWINQFRFEGQGQVEGGMTHVVQGTVEVPEASVTLSSGTAWIGKTPAVENVALKAVATLDRFHPKKQKGLAMLPFISAGVQIQGKIDSLDFIKIFFRKVPWLRIEGEGQIDADMRLVKGVLAPQTRFSVATANLSTNVLEFAMAAQGPGKIEGRVEREGEKAVATVSVALADFEIGLPTQEKTLLRGRDLSFGGKSSELDLRDPFTDLTMIVDTPDIELKDLSVLNAWIPKQLGFTIRKGTGHMRLHAKGSALTLATEGSVELSAQGLVADYRDLTLDTDLQIGTKLQYGLLEDEKGVRLASNVPLRINRLALAIPNATVREKKRVLAEELSLDIRTKFDRSNFEKEKMLGLLRFTSGDLQLAAKFPELGYLSNYLSRKRGMRIRSGAGEIQAHLQTAAGQSAAQANIGLRVKGLDAQSGDLALRGNMILNSDVEYDAERRINKGLLVLGNSGHLEILKAAFALDTAEVRERRQTLAQDLSLQFESEFAPYRLDVKNTSELLRASAVSLRTAAQVPDLRYLGKYIPADTGLRIGKGQGRLEAQFRSTAGQASATGRVALISKELVISQKKEMQLTSELKASAEVRYGETDDMAGAGLIVFDEGPLAIARTSLRLKSGRLVLRDGRAVENLTLSLDSTFDRLALKKLESREALRAVSADIRIAGHVPDLRFLKGYFHQASWLKLDGAGQLEADVQVRRGVLMPGTRIAVDSEKIQANFMDYTASGSGKVRGLVTQADGKTFSRVSVSLDDFGFARLKQPYIFGSGFTVTGTAERLDLTDPFTDLKVAIELPESNLPNFGAYNSYIPPDSCIFIYQGRGRIRSHFDFDAATESASGSISLSAEKIIIQFDQVTIVGDLKLKAHLKDGNMEARAFDMAGTTIEFSNGYVGSNRIETETDWWARFELPKGNGQFTTPAQLDARIQMSLRDSRPLVVFLAEEKGIVRWFKNMLTVKDIQARADFRMEGKAVEVEDLEMTGDRFEVLGELDIFSRQFAGVFYARLRDLSVAVELRPGQKKFKLSKSKPWYEKRRQVYKAHKWFAKQDGVEPELPPEADAVVTKKKRKKSARTGCWE